MIMRDASAGTASGKGSFKAENLTELQAWAQINTGIDEFQLSQFLPGGNYGVFMIFNNGKLRKLAIAERIEYIMAKVAVSGITGNTRKGRLMNDELIKGTALKAIDIICKETNTIMNGLVVCDMKANENGIPLVTEINNLISSFGYNGAIRFIASSQLIKINNTPVSVDDGANKFTFNSSISSLEKIIKMAEKCQFLDPEADSIENLQYFTLDLKPNKDKDYWGR